MTWQPKTQTGTTTPVETQTRGGTVRAATGDTSQAEDDVLLYITTGGANATVTMLSAVNLKGRSLTVKRANSANSVLVLPATGESVDGTTNPSTYSLGPTQYNFVTMVSDGANWLIVSERVT